MEKEKDNALVSKAELSLIENNLLNERQLQFLLQRTPRQYIKERPAKGGGKWKYVTGGYVRKVLNLMFGFNWTFEIVDEQIFETEVVVKGKLTIWFDSGAVTKMQYGNKEIMRRKADNQPLSIGNDMKAAATDALKKCAAEIGIAADVYNSEEFREVKIAEAQNPERYDKLIEQ